jgi:N-methylhydantoinase B
MMRTSTVNQTRPEVAVDPITLTLIWKTLISVCDEMASALRRTAFSEAVREGDDFSTALFDRRARLIAQGNCTPGHLGAMPYVVQNVLKYIPPEQLEPGDTLVTNDSFLGGGHFPDFYFVTPVFSVKKRLIGYVVNIAHHVDVGGLVPGSQGVQGVTEAYAEGIRVLPVKLIRNGEFDEALIRVILGNVRLPDKMQGDLWAQRNANNAGVARLNGMFEEHGEGAMESAIEEILNRSEERTREQISKIPDGVYSFDDKFDDYGPGTEPIAVGVDVTIRGGDVVVDFSRSGEQVAAGMNCYINYTRAYAMFGVRIFADVDVPHNAGVERVITVVAREGSFFNAKYPAAGGGRSTCQVRIFESINGALSKARPGRAMGAFSHWGNPNFGGRNDITGKQWIMYDLILGGYGGQVDKDGLEMFCPVFNCANIPVEVHETVNPVRIKKLGIIPDTGGAGRHRGGCGMQKDVEILSNDTIVTLLGDRHLNPPYGLFGGQPGKCAETILIRDGERVPLGSKELKRLRRGDIVSFRLSGAGGYGDPRERRIEDIQDDVRNGYVSREAAKEAYGLSDADFG